LRVLIWKSPKGTLFVLVGMPKNSIKTNIKTSLKSEKALWQKFLAQKADKELDKEIDKEFWELISFFLTFKGIK